MSHHIATLVLFLLFIKKAQASNPWLQETENKIQTAKSTETTLDNGKLNVHFEPTNYSSLINVIVDLAFFY